MGLQLRNKPPKRRVKAKLRDDRQPAVQINEGWRKDNNEVRMYNTIGYKPRYRSWMASGNPASMSRNPGKFQCRVAKNRGVRQVPPAKIRGSYWKLRRQFDLLHRNIGLDAFDPLDPR